MEHVAAQLQDAIERHHAGELNEAEKAYRSIIEQAPDRWEARYLLGTVLLQQNRFSESIPFLARAASEQPSVPDIPNNLGVAYKALGRWKEATQAFQCAIQANADYVPAWHNLGTLMADRGIPVDAEKCFRRAIDITPQNPELRRRLADSLNTQQKWPEAEAEYQQILSQEPDNLTVLVNCGFVLVRQEKLDEAAAIYRRILAMRPDYCEIHNNLSYVAERLGKFDEAIAHGRDALAIRPGFADAHNNLGVARRSMHRLEEARDEFQKALELRSDFALAEFNLATTRLLAGEYAEGWTGYERRLEAIGLAPREFSQPRWNGAAIPGKKLLVHADQGFGDTIQFARLLVDVQKRSGARITLECQSELVRLFDGLAGTDQVIAAGEALPPCDVHIPLASLPGVLGITLDNLPANVPYLQAPDKPRPELQTLIDGAASDSLKVGIAWQGNPAQAHDALRSCPLSHWLPLKDVANVVFFSLQTDEAPLSQLTELSGDWEIIDVGTHLKDFADTSAVLAQMDLIVTVDTALAHLSAAMAHPTWTMLCHTPDWRWHLDRTDSPWYPTIRLFRQPAWGDWASVITDVRSELIDLAARR